MAGSARTIVMPPIYSLVEDMILVEALFKFVLSSPAKQV
jgi:hypothetical protein